MGLGILLYAIIEKSLIDFENSLEDKSCDGMFPEHS